MSNYYLPLKEPKFKYNQTILKVYGYITMNCLRTSGVEDEHEEKPLRGVINDSKLEENQSLVSQRLKCVFTGWKNCKK